MQDAHKVPGRRFYDPASGRFLTQDPAGEGTNWYAYVGNNPLNLTDPTGTTAARLGAGLGAAFGMPAVGGLLGGAIGSVISGLTSSGKYRGEFTLETNPWQIRSVPLSNNYFNLSGSSPLSVLELPSAWAANGGLSFGTSPLVGGSDTIKLYIPPTAASSSTIQPPVRSPEEIQRSFAEFLAAADRREAQRAKQVSFFSALLPATSTIIGNRVPMGYTEFVHSSVIPLVRNPLGGVTNFVTTEPHIAGGLKTIEGLGEIIVGGAGLLTTLPTVVGTVVSGAALLHGIDTLQAGLREMVSGSYKPSLTVQGLTHLTGNTDISEAVNAGAGIILSLGSGWLTQGAKVPASGGRVTQFYRTGSGFAAPTEQALVSPATLGGHIVDGAKELQTWVVPARANTVNWFQRLMAGVPFRRSFVEFSTLAGETMAAGGLKRIFAGSQAIIPGVVNLAGRAAAWGRLAPNYGGIGFVAQLISALIRINAADPDR